MHFGESSENYLIFLFLAKYVFCIRTDRGQTVYQCISGNFSRFFLSKIRRISGSVLIQDVFYDDRKEVCEDYENFGRVVRQL